MSAQGDIIKEGQHGKIERRELRLKLQSARPVHTVNVARVFRDWLAAPITRGLDTAFSVTPARQKSAI